MAFQVLDPTHEDQQGSFAYAPRLATLEGKTIAVISNGKKGTRPFFDAYERNLREQYRVAHVVRLTKMNYSAPVETALLTDAEQWDALVAGIGD